MALVKPGAVVGCLTVFLVVAFLVGVARMSRKSAARAEWVASTNDAARADKARMVAALGPHATDEEVIRADDMAHERGIAHDALHAKGVEFRLQAAARVLQRNDADLSQLYAVRRSLAGVGEVTPEQARRVSSLRAAANRRISLAEERRSQEP